MKNDFDNNIKIIEAHPYLLRLVIREDIGIETMIILNKLTPFFDYWTKKLADDILWESVKKKSEKYEKFFINSVDLSKYRSYTMEYFG